MNFTIESGAFLCLLSFIVSTLTYPLVLRIARKYGIMDNPNARKLQRVPVPVMGGVAVFLGIVASVLVWNIKLNDTVLWVGLVAMTIMLILGAIDDATDMSASLRFVIEIVVVYWVILVSEINIDCLHGLWGIETVDLIVSLPLSILAGVGIINAINLIDGVDGYSSGFGILSCIMFSCLFYYAGDDMLGGLALMCVGALVPFFMHNVFGRSSKMFIGDSGTLMIGTVLTIMVFSALSSGGSCGKLESEGIGLVPFTLAVMSVPVFDTLRVMGVRILRGGSPFHPDKSHLHHLFIEMGFSHIGTSFCILLINTFIVGAWFLTWKLGGSISVQFTVVVVLSILVTFGFYHFIKVQESSGPLDEDGYPTGSAIWKFCCMLGVKSHVEDNAFWTFLRNFMDGVFLPWNKNKSKSKQKKTK